MKENQGSSPFLEGPVLPALLKFALPVLAALFLQAMYGAVDLIVIGAFSDAAGVSAVATGSAVMQLVTFVITGLSMGATIVIGQHIGEERPGAAGETVGAAIVLFAILSLFFTGFMELFVRPLTALMQAPAEAFEQTVQYVRICSLGLFFIVAYNVISGIFRGLGNSRLPMIFVSIACAVNIVGDLLFIGYFGLDVRGAALATVLAQAVSVALSLLIITKQQLPFTFTRKSIGFHRREMSLILHIGLPIALQDVLVNLSFLLINALINRMGLDESAGYGIASRLIVFIMLVPSATMSSVSAFVAQNIGAGKLSRAKKAMTTAMKAGVTAGVGLFLLGFSGGEAVARLFTADRQVILQAASYLRGFSVDCLLTCILFSFIGYFNGRGETIYVMLQGISSALLVRVPLSWVLSRMDGATLGRIGLAAPLTTVYGIIFFYCCYRYVEKHGRRLPEKQRTEADG